MNTRMNLNLSDQMVRDLAYLRDTHGATATDAVRRALRVAAYIDAATVAGAKLVFEMPNGERLTTLIL